MNSRDSLRQGLVPEAIAGRIEYTKEHVQTLLDAKIYISLKRGWPTLISNFLAVVKLEVGEGLQVHMHLGAC